MQIHEHLKKRIQENMKIYAQLTVQKTKKVGLTSNKDKYISKFRLLRLKAMSHGAQSQIGTLIISLCNYDKLTFFNDNRIQLSTHDHFITSSLTFHLIYHRQSSLPYKSTPKHHTIHPKYIYLFLPIIHRSLLAISAFIYINMLKDKIVIVDVNKKTKLVSEENFYEKVRLIGQGTFGKVYLAKGRKDGRQWALKEVLQDRRYKNRQLSIIARTEHCNIVTMKEYFLKMVRDDCYLTMIMDYIPSSLNLLIKQQRKLKKPFSAVIRKLLAFQMFKALYYMQLTRICHRDLKPPNVLINDQTFELKICDFGSAKIFQKEQSNVSYICSRYYLMQATDYGTQIDVWSAGCIIVELLTLEPIFPGDSSQQQLIEIMKILGTPPQRYINLYEEQKNIHYNFPLIKPTSWQAILHKYQPQKELIQLISKMLTYDTKARLTPFQALKHPYFWDLPSFTSYTAKLPFLFYFSDLENTTNPKPIEQLEKLYPRPQPELKTKNQSGSIGQPIKKQTTPITCTE